MASVTLAPVAPWLVLVLLAGVGALLVWWPAGAAEPPQPRSAQVRRSAAVALLLLAALRPGVPGGSVTVTTTDLDVYFVVDTTSSMSAEDYDGTSTRLDGVRADVAAIAGGLAGARYSLLTFDHETVTRLPLTTDVQALGTAMEVLRPETSTYSQGSSVTVAGPELDSTLQQARQTHPERARIVFYLGDGEQTASTAPEPFALEPTLVNGGAVLGYGTTAGGRMKESGTGRDTYVSDPGTGQPAVSRIDETMLHNIAQQLSLPYLHRTAPGGPSVLDSVQLKETGALTPSVAGGVAAGRTELYWALLLGVAALAAWELAATLATVRLRERRTGPPSPDRAGRPPTPPSRSGSARGTPSAPPSPPSPPSRVPTGGPT